MLPCRRGLGPALLAVSLGIRFLRPYWPDYQQYAALAGLVCIRLYLVMQWRDSATGRSRDCWTMPASCGIGARSNPRSTTPPARWN